MCRQQRAVDRYGLEAGSHTLASPLRCMAPWMPGGCGLACMSCLRLHPCWVPVADPRVPGEPDSIPFLSRFPNPTTTRPLCLQSGFPLLHVPAHRQPAANRLSRSPVTSPLAITWARALHTPSPAPFAFAFLAPQGTQATTQAVARYQVAPVGRLAAVLCKYQMGPRIKHPSVTKPIKNQNIPNGACQPGQKKLLCCAAGRRRPQAAQPQGFYRPPYYCRSFTPSSSSKPTASI